jgi:predicted nucleic acid-binding protein
VIYLDTSVALAQLFAEDRRPPASLWGETLVSSRLLEYEVWNRVNARGLAKAHEPFPSPVRTLDALHLASMDFLRRQGQRVSLASYDDRFVAAAKRMKFDVTPL